MLTPPKHQHLAGVKLSQANTKHVQANTNIKPATAEKSKIKQPSIRLALSRAGTLAAMASAPKRKRSGITPDSCGKAGVVTLTTLQIYSKTFMRF